MKIIMRDMRGWERQCRGLDLLSWRSGLLDPDAVMRTIWDGPLQGATKMVEAISQTPPCTEYM